MKKKLFTSFNFFSLLLILLCSTFSSRAQQLYVCTSTGEIYLIDLATCKSTLIVKTTKVWNDMAICADNPKIAYGIDSSTDDLYSIDLQTGVVTFLNNQISSSSNPHTLTSLVCDGNGHLYAGDAVGTNIYTYDIGKNNWTLLGNSGYSSAGDLTFYNGNLYLATTANTLISMTISPFSVTSHGTFNSSAPVWGICTVTTGVTCNNVTYSMVASSGNNIFHVDPATAQMTPFCPNIITNDIYGMASLSESSKPLPSFTVTIQTTPATCSTSNGSSTVSVSNPGNYTYSWNPGGSTGQTASGLAPGTYTVTATDANGCTASVTSVITSTPINWTASATHTNTSCSGPTGTASASSTAAGTPGYLWNTGATTQTVSGLAAGTYTVTVKDANGCTATATTSVGNSSGPAVSPLTFTGLKCYGDQNGTATVSANGGTGTLTYSWSNGATGQTASGLSANTYTVTVSDGAGCTVVSTVTITEPMKLKIQSSVSAATCSGKCDGQTTISSSGGASPYTYSWSNSATDAGVSTLCAGSYSITISDISQCKHDTTIVIAEPAAISFTTNNTPALCGKSNGSAAVTPAGGTSPYTYSWNTAGTGSNISNIPSGTYTLTVQDAKGCQQTVSVIVPSISPDKFNFSPEKNLSCYGDKNGSLTINGSGSASPYTYSWSDGQTTNTASHLAVGNYTLVVTDNTGCKSTLVDSILQPTKLNTVNSVKTICIGQSATLIAGSSGGTGPYTYTWNTTANGSDYTVSPAATSYYTLETTDANGCKTIVVDTVNVIPLPQAAFSGPDVCMGVPTVFNDASTVTGGGAISSWIWNLGDGTTMEALNPTHTYTKAGTYTVSLTVSIGTCQTTASHVITVYPAPVADFAASPQPTSILNPTITFTDLSVGGDKGLWTFGDMKDTIYTPGNNPVHTYPNENIEGGETFVAKLFIINQSGCPDSVIKTIHIDPEFTFYCPNTFTPNGDGKNDLFFGVGFGIIEKEMWIFDRWGNQIFHTNDLYGGWDGKVQGGSSNEIAQEDTYVWLIRVKEVFGKFHSYVGHVNIIR